MNKFPPEPVIEVHHLLFDAGVGTVLAGGALRDHLMKREVKDYDLFVLGKNWMYSTALEMFPHTIADDGRVYTKAVTAYSNNTRCGDVWEFTYCGEQINVIFPCLDGDGAWDTPQDVIDHFDTNLNLLWYDCCDGVLHVDPRWVFLDLDRKVKFISDPHSVGYTRVQRRYERLQPKYPELDWSGVINWLEENDENGSSATDAPGT